MLGALSRKKLAFCAGGRIDGCAALKSPMYQAFNLNLSLQDFYAETGHEALGEQIAAANRVAVNNVLSTGFIDGAKVQEEWFPDVNADVFISHSHRDHKLALQLAGWLQAKHGLRAFVDSAVWGYADDLLWEIDSRWCKMDDGNFSYHLRNGTTGHVHMMLATALGKLIDSTECLMFLNTPNSLRPAEVVLGEEGKPRTFSPWIYYEISALNLVERKTPSRITNFSEGNKRASFPAVYPLDLERLVRLPTSVLVEAWQAGKRGREALDRLYQTSGILKEMSTGGF